jgi:hypothetical protein
MPDANAEDHILSILLSQGQLYGQLIGSSLLQLMDKKENG